MTLRPSTLALGIAAGAVLVTTTGALAAYTSPRLVATQSGNTFTLDVAQSAADDPTAIVRIISPLQTELAESRPVGASVGTASASFVATTAGSATLTAAGSVEVAVAGRIEPADLSGCASGERVEGLWSMRLAGDGLAVTVPVYLLVGGDLLLCLPHPNTLPQGAKLVGLRLTISGALRLRPVGTWISIWVPYGAAGADLSRAVASPAVVGAGTVTFSARTRGKGAVVVGHVHQGGAPRADARVRIVGGERPARMRHLGTARTNGGGQFTFRAKSGTFFRATATVERTSPPGICFVLEPFLRPIPCVNPTLGGFSVQSATVRKR